MHPLPLFTHPHHSRRGEMFAMVSTELGIHLIKEMSFSQLSVNTAGSNLQPTDKSLFLYIPLYSHEI